MLDVNITFNINLETGGVYNVAPRLISSGRNSMIIKECTTLTGPGGTNAGEETAEKDPAGSVITYVIMTIRNYAYLLIHLRAVCKCILVIVNIFLSSSALFCPVNLLHSMAVSGIIRI